MSVYDKLLGSPEKAALFFVIEAYLPPDFFEWADKNIASCKELETLEEMTLAWLNSEPGE